jgi:predicted lipoprotein
MTLADISMTKAIVHDHIQPRFERLTDKTNALATVASKDCNATSQSLRTAYADAFDAWVSASHLRFGPTEVDDRAFAIAFWPDSRGATLKVLKRLIVDQDPIADSIEKYADVSIAARGFYALEFLLYDDTLKTFGNAAYRCTLIQTISADTALITAAISNDWRHDYPINLLEPSTTGTYRTHEEVQQEFLKALSTGLQFTAETRLGRPLGTYQKPRPKRAEAWRSGRSAKHVADSLKSLREMAAALANDNDLLASDLDTMFEKALEQLADLNDPVFAGVADPQSRLKIEIIQQAIETIRTIVRDRLGPELGVTAGFNSLDGD